MVLCNPGSTVGQDKCHRVQLLTQHHHTHNNLLAQDSRLQSPALHQMLYSDTTPQISKKNKKNLGTDLHRSGWISNDDSLTITELGVDYGDVPEGDVLVDEVLVLHGTLHVVRQLWPEDAAGVRVLLGWANPDCELLRSFHPDVLIQDIGYPPSLGLISSPKLHVYSLQ